MCRSDSEIRCIPDGVLGAHRAVPAAEVRRVAGMAKEPVACTFARLAEGWEHTGLFRLVCC